ncbi:class I SAM-dependent methyltransferase [Glycomyces terrestris]|uniref:Class I SAM-dependent methyltransferase n=1 Tax=Glycomyces terrestris TaxID=2493553 RepID=A0A426URN9_9ACTN|nr:class I SAM-dependent methyltransferase [Glycomyces terrestris]RRR95832.1 class I SAM-dependent methyltransferase [Glycomyces terrestris]
MPHDHHHRHGGAIEGRHSDRYNRFARLFAKAQYRRIAADIASAAPQDAAVLDVGTGPGLLLRNLADLRPDLRLAGVDLAADMVAHAERNLADLPARPDLRAADVAALPFEDGAFDLVVSTYSSHHWSDPETGGAEIARVLRPAGRFLNYDFPRAPFDAFDDLTETGRTAFRTPWTLFMKTIRFEAVDPG